MKIFYLVFCALFLFFPPVCSLMYTRINSAHASLTSACLAIARAHPGEFTPEQSRAAAAQLAELEDAVVLARRWMNKAAESTRAFNAMDTEASANVWEWIYTKLCTHSSRRTFALVCRRFARIHYSRVTHVRVAWTAVPRFCLSYDSPEWAMFSPSRLRYVVLGPCEELFTLLWPSFVDTWNKRVLRGEVGRRSQVVLSLSLADDMLRPLGTPTPDVDLLLSVRHLIIRPCNITDAKWNTSFKWLCAHIDRRRLCSIAMSVMFTHAFADTEDARWPVLRRIVHLRTGRVSLTELTEKAYPGGLVAIVNWGITSEPHVSFCLCLDVANVFALDKHRRTTVTAPRLVDYLICDAPMTNLEMETLVDALPRRRLRLDQLCTSPRILALVEGRVRK